MQPIRGARLLGVVPSRFVTQSSSAALAEWLGATLPQEVIDDPQGRV